MSTNTSNFNLIKPELTDAADITAYNANWDTIDTELHNLNEVTDAHGEQLNAINQELAVMDDRHSKLNLLVNSCFSRPVNQRGKTSYIGENTIDRWVCYEDDTLTINDGYITISGVLHQYVENLNVNKIHTAAICLADDELYVYSGVLTALGSWNDLIYCNVDGNGITTFRINATTALNVKWVALYEGKYTVDTLPPYTPKDFEVERLNCNGGASNSFKGTLTSSGWSSSAPYTQTITVDGILATDEPFVDVDLSSVSNAVNVLEAWSVVGRLTASANNTITAYCYEEKPTVDIPVLMKVVR